ncbi:MULTISPECIES: AAA family ATPase [unclassified Streptomyces]|uniref:ATP-dependent nuclease n=1 Tax=unclassified Streptomyces TaxID=2593676 RepID=UPI002DDB649D|nr:MULTISPECIES: AAA family ATPase [unclassified Streptomyces]WSA91661.1 AAA family ATPase [Streptomyces sp. NBC_01795]WSB76033.1 AAA family ATPase [Streptomyces sp. NBC_01775]WSS15693.1 AAA family ATPase [Streptomyces sp. NBC_01186]WSS44534.1 AAA family ATPase [Streptomyces sp. NBC_01187]
MQFEVRPYFSPVPSQRGYYLFSDSWDDFGFKTTYLLVVRTSDGETYTIGQVGIGQFGLDSGRPELPLSFDALDSERFFSLGQDDGYYEGLQALGPTARTQILTALCDVAYSPTLLEGAMGEEVLNRSLLRSVTLTTVVAQFHRIAHGGARLTPFRFTFDAPTGGTDTEPSVRLRFDVTPESTPPTNIHALIGSNGVGKTHLLRAFARAAVGLGDGTGGVVTNIADDEQLFTNMVSVSFSAFDPFTAVEPDSVVPHTYVSLSQEPSGEMENSTPIFKEPHQLANEYVEVLADLNGELLRRWITALETMGFDSLVYLIKPFAMGEAPYNPDSIEIGEALKAADRTSMARSFSRMSSGHKIVLLAITHLVRRVTERSLVLIDEPETHLHPPLLSAFIRAVSDLLTNRNGVAIIATHSPVVLQETPRSCVSVLRRSGTALVADRPDVETFGENVGVLTREVFGLEVTRSGFHRELEEAVARRLDYQQIVDRFGGQLGGEARALLRSMIAIRDRRDQEEGC